MSKEINPISEQIRKIFLAGYLKALDDYSIWNDGTQRIGCMNYTKKEAFLKELHRETFDVGANIRAYLNLVEALLTNREKQNES